MTPIQSRAARGLLNLSQVELGTLAGVSAGTIKHFETGQRNPNRATLAQLRQTFEARGVTFLGERGVELAEGVEIAAAPTPSKMRLPKPPAAKPVAKSKSQSGKAPGRGRIAAGNTRARKR